MMQDEFRSLSCIVYLQSSYRQSMNFIEEHISTDFLIIGGGVGGLRAAVELSRNGEVLVVTKDAPLESSTEYARGGVAVVLSDEDEISIHLDDTIKAGDGLCVRKAVGT